MKVKKNLTPEQLEWENRMRDEFKADRLAEREAEAERVSLYVDTDNQTRQGEAYDYVHIWGLTEEVAAEKMKISRQAVHKLLENFLKRFPSQCPEIKNKDIWRPHESDRQTPGKRGGIRRSGSTLGSQKDCDRREAFSVFEDGFNTPGKINE